MSTEESLDACEFNQEETNRMDELWNKVCNMEIPEMFDSGELTEDELDARKKAGGKIIRVERMCKKCGHMDYEHKDDEYDWDNRLIKRHCEGRGYLCRCRVFKEPRKVVKVE